MDQILKNSKTKQHSHVVVMPFPGRGHINPLLNLSKLLVSHCSLINITFVLTEEWLGFLSAEPAPPVNIQYVALPQVVPSEIGRGNDIDGFVEATLTKLEEPFERLLDQLPLTATAIIYDTYMHWVVGVGHRKNIPVVSFFPMSASVFTVFYHFDLLRQHGHFPLPNVSERGNEVVDYIPGLPATTIADLTTFFDGAGEKMIHRLLPAFTLVNKAQCQLFTSIYEIEEQVISTLKAKMPIQVYHIGPLIPYFNLESNDLSCVRNAPSDESYFQWLNAQPKDSVLYISQGSFLSVSSDQMNEVVEGIKESGVRFLWVTRSDTSLFRDGVSSEMGCLVPWCDQLRVLCHPSVGGFWTHCGWNSTSEGIYAGLPMLTCPIFWDQMANSKLIVNDLKIGWRVLKNYPHKSGNIVTRKEIAQLVFKFMDSKSNERKEMVERATSLQDIFKRAIAEGGSATSNLDAFHASLS